MPYFYGDEEVEVLGGEHLTMQRFPVYLPVYMRVLLGVISQRHGLGGTKIMRNAVLRELMLYADQLSETDPPIFSEELKAEPAFDFESSEALIIALIKAFERNQRKPHEKYGPPMLSLNHLLALAERSKDD